MRLIGTKILVKPDPADNVTESGIIISVKKAEKPNRGKIVLTGPGVKEEPMKVTEGKYIQYDSSKGIPVNHRGDDLLILNQSDIQAILN